MTPTQFPEANCIFGPPADLEESQCRPISAHAGDIQGGSCDGLRCVVVAYQLTKGEAEILREGGLLYLTMVGGLVAHFPSLCFYDATHPA